MDTQPFTIIDGLIFLRCLLYVDTEQTLEAHDFALTKAKWGIWNASSSRGTQLEVKIGEILQVGSVIGKRPLKLNWKLYCTIYKTYNIV